MPLHLFGLLPFWEGVFLFGRGHACGHGRGFPLAPASFGCSFSFLSFIAWQGDAPAGAPKGFPLALWKPSGVAILHGRAERVALEVQDSRPAPPRESGQAAYLLGFARGSADRQACPPSSDPLSPACRFSGDTKKFANLFESETYTQRLHRFYTTEFVLLKYYRFCSSCTNCSLAA